MAQLQLTLDAPVAPFTSPARRIDVTIDRLRADFEALTDGQRAELADKPWWAAIDAVACIRAMERGEEEALGRPSKGLADIYDRIVTPGEHAGEALLRVFQDQFSQTSE